MKAYKLLDQELRSNNGRFQWEIGKEYTIDKPGNKMCSGEVFHCYNHPALAVLFNRIHADIENPRLFEIEIPEFCNNDELKFASKSQKLIKELDLPIISIDQRIEFAIRVAKLVYDDEKWNTWADKWLSGEDRTIIAARAATAATAVYAATAATAVYAATAATAVYATNAAAANATAVYAANATANATANAAYTARAATAVYAADSAVVTNDDFIRIIEEILDKES